MSTVLRVKRRFDHEPFDALVIAGKRRKIETGDSEEVKSTLPLTEVVKFAGTVENPEDIVVEHLKKTLTKDELKSNYKQRVLDVTNRARTTAKELSREHRYKVVKYFRSIDAASSKSKDDDIVTVIDVEHSKVLSAEETSTLDENEIGYVYDLYYTQANEDIHLDDELTIHPFDQDLVFDGYDERGARFDEDASSDDSNCESHFRNDYPDSDHSVNSINDDDIRAAVGRMKIGDENSDLSSEDDFVYAIDENDVETYGYKYAKYKARIKEELCESDSNSAKSDHSFDAEYDDEDAEDTE